MTEQEFRSFLLFNIQPGQYFDNDEQKEAEKTIDMWHRIKDHPDGKSQMPILINLREKQEMAISEQAKNLYSLMLDQCLSEE